MAEIRIADDLALPLDVVTETTAILGVRGTGKTNTGTVFIEEAHEHGTQFVVVDPLAVWYGLKTSADGEHEAIPCVVFGGERGDLPLREDLAERIADVVVDTGISAVLSLAELSRAGQARFVHLFMERLYRRKAEPGRGTRLLVAIDEASSFVPQRFGAEMAKCVGSIEQLVRRGRSRGLGCVLIDQRAASINKDVLTQLDLLIAHRLTSPQDRGAILDWVKGSDDPERAKELESTLASIGRGEAKGEAWVWSPLLEIFQRARIRRRTTFDSSRTPGPGEIPIVPTRAAAVDLDALRAAFAPGEDGDDREDKAKPPARRGEYAAEIERLNALVSQLARERDEAEARAQEFSNRLYTTYVRNVANRDVLAKLLTELGETTRHLRISHEWATREVERDRAEDALKNRPILLETADGASPEKAAESSPPVQDEHLAKASDNIRSSGKPDVSGPQQRILDVLAALAPMGMPTVRKDVAALFAAASPTSSSYQNNLGRLRTLGLIDYPSGRFVALTEGGRAIATATEVPITLAGFQTRWLAIVSGPQAKILRKLIECHPHAASKELVAEHLGVSATSSSYQNNLGRLRSLGLVDYPQAGRVVATDLLFPEGLR